MPLPPANTARTLSFPADLPPSRPPSLPQRYSVDGVLGQGSQGAVYSGTDSLTGVAVAIKVLPASGFGARSRVTREVAALRLLDVPGVVRLLDSGGDDRDTWIVMEHVVGDPFPAGRKTWDELRPVLTTLLEALARVHDVGLLHRDIKPQNVLVDAAGRPYLLDFGLVRGTVAGPTITRMGTVMGTPLYMPPEQVRGDRADRRSDLYALGAMVREALTGQVPFQSEHIGLMFEARVRSDPPTIQSELPDLPAEVVALLDALVARRPEARPASARAALSMLGGASLPEVLPWIGPRDAVLALVAAARRGDRATVTGPRGSGRTRTLQEVARALTEDGRTPRWVAPSDAPLGSLRGLLGEPDPADLEPLETMRTRLDAALQGGEPILVDDWEGVDPWSRSLLAAATGAVLASTLLGAAPPLRSLPPGTTADPPLAETATLRAFAGAELRALFGGSDRLLHLPSDASALLFRRTGGIAARIASEIQRWTEAGLATLVPGNDPTAQAQIWVTRAALDRIAGGFAGPPVADVVDHALPVELDELLAWVHLASPGCTVQRLASARGEPAWRIDLAVRQLEALGAIARLGGSAPGVQVLEPMRPSDALVSWVTDVRLAAHGAIARTLQPGAEGRMVHLVALGDGRAAVDDACALADRLVDDGRVPEAMAALLEAARLALSTEVEARLLWKQVATLAIQDGTRPVLAAAADILERSDAGPELLGLVTAALRQMSGERGAGPPPVPVGAEESADPDIQRLYWEVRVQAARGEGGKAYKRIVGEAEEWAWATATDAARAARANWVSSWLYQAGQIREAADEAEAGVLIPQPLGAKTRLMVRAMSCLLEVREVDRALAMAGQLAEIAEARRLPKVEAYAEWLRRAVANRLRTATGVDEELVAAVGEIGAPEVAAFVWVNEAVIAWWSGSPARGAELAGMAERALMAAGATVTAVWARAVRIACAPDAAAADACAGEAIGTGRADIIFEVLGVLKISGGLSDIWRTQALNALSRLEPKGYESWRRGALSPDEVAELFA